MRPHFSQLYRVRCMEACLTAKLNWLNTRPHSLQQKASCPFSSSVCSTRLAVSSQVCLSRDSFRAKRLPHTWQRKRSVWAGRCSFKYLSWVKCLLQIPQANSSVPFGPSTTCSGRKMKQNFYLTTKCMYMIKSLILNQVYKSNSDTYKLFVTCFAFLVLFPFAWRYIHL